jgi:hypothetical protein
MEATTTITSYTIPRPRHNDLVLFYPPVYSGEIFRVSEITIPTNTMFSKPSVEWAELELQYAPLKDTNNLKINQHYVYDISKEKHIKYSDYVSYIKQLSDFSNSLSEILKFYNKYKDLYEVEGKIPICVNELLIIFKRIFSQKYLRVFEKYKSPFGYYKYLKELKFTELSDFPFNDIHNTLFQLYNIYTEEIEDYNWIDRTTFTNDIEKILYYGNELFIGMKTNGY